MSAWSADHPFWIVMDRMSSRWVQQESLFEHPNRQADHTTFLEACNNYFGEAYVPS